MTKLRNRLRSTVEYLIIAILLLGGISLFFADPITTGGPIANLVGSREATFVYGTIFILEAAILTYAKWFKKKKTHKHMLMVIYLTTIFVLILEVVLLGWSIVVIDEIILGALAGWCWVQWKMATEYLNPRQWRDLTSEVNHYDSRD